MEAPFIGRERELGELARLLATTRVLTIAGAGGSGKTRLAVELASRERAADGRDEFVVRLEGVETPELVPSAVLEALGERERPGQPALAVGAARLRRGPALLVVDNCEHLRAAVADAVASLLAAAPELRVVATSREPLQIVDEVVWHAPPMSLPGDGEELEPLVAVLRSDAGRLFLQCAASHDAELTLTSAAASAVVRICRELDGLPLAIELAAARVADVPLAEIVAALGDRFALAEGGRPPAPARRRSLRASLEWSHDLLDETERVLMRRLAVFTGGFAPEAAAAVCAVPEAERHLPALAEKGLLSAAAKPLRYAMLETVRGYAAERLVEAGEAEAVETRHLEHFKTLALQAEARLAGPDGRALLAAEVPNLRRAFDRALALDPRGALDMAAGLGRFWLVTDRYQEGRTACERALSVDERDDARRTALVLRAAGLLALHSLDYERAGALASEALASAERAGDPRAIGRCLQTVSLTIGVTNPPAGAATARRAVELLRAADDRQGLAQALVTLASIESLRDGFEAMRAACEQFLELSDGRDDPWLRAWAEGSLATAANGLGRPRAALEHTAHALELEGEPLSMTAYVALAARVEALARLGSARQARELALTAMEFADPAETGIAVPVLQLALAVAELALGDLHSAERRAQRVGRAPHAYLAGHWQDVLAHVALGGGDAAAARSAAARLREQAAATGSPRHRARAAWAEGCAALLDGALPAAADRLHAALEGSVEGGYRYEIADALDALAALAGSQGTWPRAARLAGAATALRRTSGFVRIPPGSGELHARGAEAIGAEDWELARAAGEALSLEQAVAYARRARGRRDRPGSGWESLTPAETQVAELAAAGLSNPEIGTRLFMSRSTVKIHLSRAYAKLGVANRAQLAGSLAARTAPVA